VKKFALALIATSALVFGLGTVAQAQTYSPTLTLIPSPPALGAPYQARLTNCTIGASITFAQAQSTPASVVVTCAAVSGAATGPGLGQATASFTAAPTVPGTYTLTAGGLSASLPIAQATTTVPATTVATPVPTTATAPAGGLPPTGSDGLGTTTGIAIALLAVGAGLFIVAQVRRRNTSPSTA
jgi:hypothetical protein